MVKPGIKVVRTFISYFPTEQLLCTVLTKLTKMLGEASWGEPLSAKGFEVSFFLLSILRYHTDTGSVKFITAVQDLSIQLFLNDLVLEFLSVRCLET